MTTTANTDVFEAQERIALARLACEANNFAEALRMLKPVLQAADVPAEALALGGAVYMQLRLFDRAEKLFTRCLEKHPKAPWERCQLGAVQAQMGKRTEALNAWDQVLKDQPNFFPALLYKGMALLQDGKIPEAKQALDGVLRAAPAGTQFFEQAKQVLQALDAQVAAVPAAPRANTAASGSRLIPEAYRTTTPS